MHFSSVLFVHLWYLVYRKYSLSKMGHRNEPNYKMGAWWQTLRLVHNSTLVFGIFGHLCGQHRCHWSFEGQGMKLQILNGLYKRWLVNILTCDSGNFVVVYYTTVLLRNSLNHTLEGKISIIAMTITRKTWYKVGPSNYRARFFDIIKTHNWRAQSESKYYVCFDDTT